MQLFFILFIYLLEKRATQGSRSLFQTLQLQPAEGHKALTHHPPTRGSPQSHPSHPTRETIPLTQETIPPNVLRKIKPNSTVSAQRPISNPKKDPFPKERAGSSVHGTHQPNSHLKATLDPQLIFEEGEAGKASTFRSLVSKPSQQVGRSPQASNRPPTSQGWKSHSCPLPLRGGVRGVSQSHGTLHPSPLKCWHQRELH